MNYKGNNDNYDVQLQGFAAGAFDSSFGNVSVNVVFLRRRIYLVQRMTVIFLSLAHR